MKTYRNAERTKKWIRRTFTEMLAEKKDIEKITVTELAKRADISKTTFYYHYEDIYAVAEEFENELIAQLSEVLSEYGRDHEPQTPDFEHYALKIVDFLKEHEESYRMVMTARSPRQFTQKLKKIIAEKIYDNVPYDSFTSEFGIWQVKVCFLVGACVDVAVEYFKGEFSVSFDTITQVILEAVNKLASC